MEDRWHIGLRAVRDDGAEPWFELTLEERREAADAADTPVTLVIALSEVELIRLVEYGNALLQDASTR